MIAADFYGTDGGLSFRNQAGSFYDFTAGRFQGIAREPLATPPDFWGDRAAADWARGFAAGAGFDPAAERLVDVSAALDRTYGR